MNPQPKALPTFPRLRQARRLFASIRGLAQHYHHVCAASRCVDLWSAHCGTAPHAGDASDIPNDYVGSIESTKILSAREDSFFLIKKLKVLLC